MKVRYVGPHDAVEVPLPDGREDAVVEHGALLETTEEHAKALLEQASNWEPVGVKKTKEKEASDGTA